MMRPSSKSPADSSDCVKDRNASLLAWSAEGMFLSDGVWEGCGCWSNRVSSPFPQLNLPIGIGSVPDEDHQKNRNGSTGQGLSVLDQGGARHICERCVH